ncbi:MAG TPA: photosynthetic complex assembly protein PuhC [Sphingorhabdus sp.]|nr:photosynthetic complex assembly protein PuhC [Sphingorhabdus sp.]
MSHAHHHDEVIPPAVIKAAGALVLATMALTGAVTLGWLPQSGNPEASRAAANVVAVEERELRFADRPDGAVVISDAGSGETVKIIAFGEGGFVRATLRRMAKARAAKGIGQEPSFKLVRWENGALSLTDPQTGREAEIHGFGADHSRAFAEMLEGPVA